MAGLIPFNRRSGSFLNTGVEDFYNMLDDFFTEGWPSGRNLLRDTFKLDVRETELEYLIDAELPGVKKDEVSLDVENEILRISVNREENADKKGDSYLHRERRVTSMSRSVRLSDANPEDIKAKLENGVLTVSVPKKNNTCAARKINIE